MKDRKLKCLKSFSSEGRYCLKGMTYTAYYIDGTYRLVFENGEMIFDSEFFDEVLESWKSVFKED
ncbi:hypothetical protein IGK74_002361 [Enterococcus sp. AZ150]|uniref:hypothetical protein n=1 Tax=Enterococcus sp. AZ150 TaxID=2774866 RepID=UPI003F2502D2